MMKTTFSLFWRAIQAYMEDRAMRMAAALSYYTAFSLAPLLVIATAVAGLFIGRRTARGVIAGQIEDQIGPQAAQTIENAIRNVSSLDGNLTTTAISLAALLFGATVVFIHLQDALNEVWNVPVQDRGDGLSSMFIKRLVSFGMVLATGFLLLVSLIISSLLTALSGALADVIPATQMIMRVISFGISFTVIAGLFGLIFRYLPDADISWSDVWLGALITSALFSVGKVLIGFYLGQAAPASIYGAAGSFAVLLLWVYYTAQIALFGAEFTHVYAQYQAGELEQVSFAR